MKRLTLSLAVVFGLSAVLVAFAVGGGCEAESCAKDTDCSAPLVCVNAVCTAVPPKGDVVPDIPVAEDGETSPTDDVVGDTDGGGDADVETDGDLDVPDDGPADDGTGPCTLELSAARAVVDNAADDAERPNAIRVDVVRTEVPVVPDPWFVFFGRAPGPVAADGLRFQRIGSDGVPQFPATWTLSSVEIGPIHPILELPDGTFAAAFAVPTGSGPGIWVKIAAYNGTLGEIPQQVAGTDASSSEPTMTFDGTSLVVAWSQASAGTVDIIGRLFDAESGVAEGDPVTLASGPTGTKEPRIVWGSIRHAFVYFDATDGALHVRMLNGDLSLAGEQIINAPSGHSFLGYPSLAWNGTGFVVAYETRGTSNATIHVATFDELGDSAPVDHTPLDGTVLLSATETGELALVWGDGEWGLAWRYVQAGRVSTHFVRIDADDFTPIGGVVDVRPGSTTAHHPSVAYRDGYYLLTWTEPSGTARPIYEATYGCPR